MVNQKPTKRGNLLWLVREKEKAAGAAGANIAGTSAGFSAAKTPEKDLRKNALKAKDVLFAKEETPVESAVFSKNSGAANAEAAGAEIQI